MHKNASLELPCYQMSKAVLSDSAKLIKIYGVLFIECGLSILQKKIISDTENINRIR